MIIEAGFADDLAEQNQSADRTYDREYPDLSSINWGKREVSGPECFPSFFNRQLHHDPISEQSKVAFLG